MKIKKNKGKKEKIGGIALSNGIILKSEKRDSITKKNSDGKIIVKIDKHFIGKSKFSLLDLPFIRGMYNIVSQLTSSKVDLKENVKAICDAFNIKYDEEELNIKTPVLIGMIIIIVIFFLVITPCLISLPFGHFKEMVQALIQFLILALLLVSLRVSKSLVSILEYHGAEHKIVNAYENLNFDELTVENVKKESRIHRRCGSNFIAFFILITILETLLITVDHIAIKMLILALLIIPNISISYELVMLLGNLPKCLAYLFYPIMAVQFMTTKNPSDDKIKLAIYGVYGVLKENLKMSVSELIKKYEEENYDLIQNKEYQLQDMLQVVSYVTKKNTNHIYISMNEYLLSYNEQIEVIRLLDQLFKEDVPLQYITNRAYFYNEEYIVNHHVLIPRQDTEILVQKAIEYISKYDLKKMIDLCTGSGCIGISIANNSDIEKVILSDISKEALSVARQNIQLNNATKVVAYLSDLLELYIDNKTVVDIIVSNPPYIKTDVIQTLDKTVLKEPRLALDGGKSGLDIYIKILDQAKYVLKEHGYLMFEIGYDELEELKHIISTHPEYELIESIKDYGGNDRVIICRFCNI